MQFPCDSETFYYVQWNVNISLQKKEVHKRSCQGPVEGEHQCQIHCIPMAEENSWLGVSSEWNVGCNDVRAALGIKADNLAVKNLAQAPA